LPLPLFTCGNFFPPIGNQRSPIRNQQIGNRQSAMT
jgi:hypothetical protein